MKNIIGFLILLTFTAFFLSCSASSPLVALEGRLLEKYQEAKRDYFNGALDQAEDGFRAISGERPDFFQGRFMLAKTLFTKGKTAEAEKLFHELVERYPMYHDAEIWLVRSELANNKIDSAENRLKRSLAFDANDPRLLSLYARLSEIKKDSTNALQYYQLSTQYEEELAFNHYEIARYYFQFGLKEKALMEIDKCLLLLPIENTSRKSVVNLKNTILNTMERKNEKK